MKMKPTMSDLFYAARPASDKASDKASGMTATRQVWSDWKLLASAKEPVGLAKSPQAKFGN